MLQDDMTTPQVFREMVRTHRCRLQKVLNDYGLYMGQPMILFALEKTPYATQKELADTLHISCATITTSLQRMEKAGLLVRAADPRDTRCNQITLTDKGKEVSTECHKAFRRMEEVTFGDFSQEELAQMKVYFTHITTNLLKLDGE